MFSSVLPLNLFHSIVTMRKNTTSASVHSFLGGSINYKKGIFYRSWITNTIEVPFENLTVPISAHYHELLVLQYGDYMTLPPEDERKCKVHAILVDTEKNHTEYEHYRDGMTFEVLTRSIR